MEERLFLGRSSRRTMFVTNTVRNERHSCQLHCAGMARPPAPRSRRERPAKPPLSREAIVAAALDIARTEGVEALSMRRVAQALDTGAASLYVYVADRREL